MADEKDPKDPNESKGPLESGSVAEQVKLGELHAQSDLLKAQLAQLKEQREAAENLGLDYAKVVKLKADEVRMQTEINELTGTQTAAQNALGMARAELIEDTAQALKLEQSKFTALTQQVTKYAEYKKLVKEAEKDNLKALTDRLRKEEKLGDQTDDQVKTEYERLKNLKQIVKETKKEFEILDKKESLNVNEKKRLEEITNAKVALGLAQQKAAKNAGGLEDSLLKALEASEDMEKATDGIKSNMTKAAFVKGAEKIGKTIASASNSALQLNTSLAEISRTTAGDTRLQAQLLDITREVGFGNQILSEYGVTTEEVAAAMSTLHQKSADFKGESDPVRKALLDTTLQLQKMGVTTETTGELFNTFKKTGINTDESFKVFADNMAKNASAIGMSVEQYVNDFVASTPVLSAHGIKASTVFSNLAKQARNSGLSVSELAQSMSQFDTFSGAADSVAKLNYLLGTQLDTTSMLGATEDERIDKLKAAFDNEQFKKMDRFRKKAIAAAAGFSDVSSFEKAMAADSKNLSGAIKNQKSLADQAQDTVTIEQKANAIKEENINQFARLSLLVEGNSREQAVGALAMGGLSSATSAAATALMWLATSGVGSAIAGGGGGLLAGAGGMIGGAGTALAGGLSTAAAAMNPMKLFNRSSGSAAGGAPKSAKTGGIMNRMKKLKMPPKLASLGKTALKFGKVAPGFGLLLGAAGAISKASQGDFAGAGLEAASGLLAMVPKFGTAAALGLQGYIAVRENDRTASKVKSAQEKGKSSAASSALKDAEKQTRLSLSLQQTTATSTSSMVKQMKELNSNMEVLIDAVKSQNLTMKKSGMNPNRGTF